MFCGDLDITVRRARQQSNLWVVSTLFNPSGYRSLVSNYKTFAQQLERDGVPLLTAELSYNGQKQSLHDPAIIRYRAQSVMWHKERLMNLLIKQLPPECQYVAWVDADIILTNQHWVRHTIERLQHVPVVQLFEQSILLDPVGNYYRSLYGFAFSYCQGFMRPPRTQTPPAYTRHPGFAWAARREAIESWGGLYDYHILGGGDYQMAMAFTGNYASEWYDRFGDKFKQHMRAWSARVYALNSGKLGFVPGVALHLFHGHQEDRMYMERSVWLKEYDYDPLTDVKTGPNGLLEWASHKPELHAKLQQFFDERQDDRDHPIHATRHEDKYPVVLNISAPVADLERTLCALARQSRMDWCLHIAGCDWWQVRAIKPLLRDRAWPFEIRLHGNYPQSQQAVSKRFQIIRQLAPDVRVDQAVLLDPGVELKPSFLDQALNQHCPVVVNEAGQPVAVRITQLLGSDVFDGKGADEVRVVEYARRTGMCVGQLSQPDPWPY